MLDSHRQARLILIHQLLESIHLAIVLTEHRDIMRLGQLVEFFDRFLGFGFESLERPMGR